MNYRIEKLNEQTWLIEEYSNTASAYMLPAHRKGKGIIDRYRIWNNPTEINM